MITQQFLRDKFDYRDGNLYWKKAPSRNTKDGQIAGALDDKGYRIITIRPNTYKAHRLIFLYHHGWLPDAIDHIDRNKGNNRIENLRPANAFENGQNAEAQSNSKTGVKGVTLVRKTNRYLATFNYQNKRYHVGCFPTLEEASKAISLKRKEVVGDWCVNG